MNSETSPLAATLLAIWAEVLRVDDLDMEDDLFFELGASSVHALRVIAAIRSKLDIEVTPETLLRAGTVAKLFAALEANSQAPLECGPLVQLRTAAQNGRRPLFLFHAAAGSVFNYRLLAQQLSGRKIYGLQDPRTFAASVKKAGVTELVDGYQSHLLGAQPQGPYLLAGHSFGGALAFEFACRLPRDVQRNTVVLMFDTPPASVWQARIVEAVRYVLCSPIYVPFLRSAVVERFKQRTHLWPVLLLGLSQGAGQLARTAAWVFNKELTGRKRPKLSAAPTEDEALLALQELVLEEHPELFQPGLTPRAVFNRARLLVENFCAFHKYVPQRKYHGRLVLFQPEADVQAKYWQQYTAHPVTTYRCTLVAETEPSRAHATLMSDSRSLASLLPSLQRELQTCDEAGMQQFA